MTDDQQVPRDDRAGPADARDETAEHPAPGDETAEHPALGDETAEHPAPDQTAALPPAPGAWSGRAQVRPPDAYRRGPAGERQGEWMEPETAEAGRWWMPIIVAVVALLLLGVLAFGLWLILNREEKVAPVNPTPSARPTTATPAATSGPPTRSAPPSVTVPAEVVVPRVTGMPEADARALLDSLGLSSRVEQRVSSDFAPGTVVTTKPPEGTAVPRGTEITLVIAMAAPTSAAPPPTAATTPAASGP